MFFCEILTFFKVLAEQTFFFFLSSTFLDPHHRVAEVIKRHLLPGISLGGENAL